MKTLITLAVCCLLALPVSAQRGDAGRGGGVGGGGGSRGGGGFRGGAFGGGAFGGGGFSNRFGFNNGFGSGGFCGVGGFRGGFNRFGLNNGFGFNSGFGCGGVGLGYFGFGGWGWGGWDYPYDEGYASPTHYAPAQQSSPGVNIIYATPPATAYTARANPVIHEYDYGQQAQQPSGAASSPIYLIAFQNDHAIRAAASYWVDGQTLHYVTQQHEEKLAPLGSIDRALTLQLNRERGVAFQLP